MELFIRMDNGKEVSAEKLTGDVEEIMWEEDKVFPYGVSEKELEKDWDDIIMDARELYFTLRSYRSDTGFKKIAGGMRYDSKKSIEVGTAENYGDTNDGFGPIQSKKDFRYWKATLYKTPRSGRFFLAGYGGAMSRFAQGSGQNSWYGGQDLIPMTRANALEWAEIYLSSEEIEHHFTIEDA